jgi:hypothetical protein
MIKTSDILFGILNFGDYDLFDFCDLNFVILIGAWN